MCSERTIEQAKIIQDAQEASVQGRAVWVDHNGFPIQARVGDRVQVSTSSVPNDIRTQLQNDPSVRSHPSRKCDLPIDLTLYGMIILSSSKIPLQDTIDGDISYMAPCHGLVLNRLVSYVSSDQNGSRGRDTVSLFPGDFRTFLGGDYTRRDYQGSLVTVFVGRCWRSWSEVRSNVIFWFTVTNSNAVKLVHISHPHGFPVLIASRSSPQEREVNDARITAVRYSILFVKGNYLL